MTRPLNCRPLNQRPLTTLALRLAAACLATVALAGCANTAHPTTQQTLAKLKDVPGPASLAVQREIGGGSIQTVRSLELEGRTVYSVAFTTEAGKKGWLQVTSDGRVLNRTVQVDKMSWAQVPEDVKAALLVKTGGVKPKAVTHEMVGETDVYNLDVDLANAEHRFSIDSGGTLVREEAAIAPSQLPVVVRAALNRRFPGMTVETAQEVRNGRTSVLTYEVAGKAGEKAIEAAVKPDGTFESVRTE